MPPHSVYVPGKLILSGEHAVVYGHPALAMAINRYVVATITRERLPQVLFDLSDLAHRRRLSFAGLQKLKNRVKQKYQRFIHGEFTIRDVLQKPFELAQVALGILADSLSVSLPHGVKIHVRSDIPIGCGMGSSASTILSVMYAVSQYLKLSLSTDAIYQLALQAENMQHGYSSGLDLRVAQQGGCVYLQDGEISARAQPQFNLFLVNTGSPLSTTGECVSHAAPFFKTTTIGDEFAAVTKQMDNALTLQSAQEMQNAIKSNHQLLTQIGVVPQRVQDFIRQVEQAGGAAKICGAGAVKGDHGGAVLVLMDDEKLLSTLCADYSYTVAPVACEPRGIYAV